MPKIVDKKMKKAEIGSAAIKVFRKIGFHCARMVDIAAAAGVGKGTLYEYFKDKTEILRFEFERYFSAFKSGALASMSDVVSPAGRLLALLDFAFEHVTAWEGHCAVYVDYFGAMRTAEDGFSLADMYSDFQKIIGLLIKDGIAAGEINGDIDPAATAELLISVFDGVILRGVFAERGCSVGAVRAAARQMVLRGILSTTPEDPSTKA